MANLLEKIRIWVDGEDRILVDEEENHKASEVAERKPKLEEMGITNPKRKVWGYLLLKIGRFFLTAFGIATLLYWIGLVSKETTDMFLVILGVPAMVLLVVGLSLRGSEKKDQNKPTNK